MTLQGTNEFRFNQATMREIVQHYLVTKLLDPEQVAVVENVEATKPDYGPQEFSVQVRCGTEEKKP